MESILNTIKKITGLIFFLVVLALLIIIQFKNGAIKRLKQEVVEKPKIEYIYQTKTDTIVKEVPTSVEVIKWKEKPIVTVNNVEIPLTSADSAQIAEAYSDLYYKYNDINKYEDVLKDDSLAFVQVNDHITQNAIAYREFIYEDRTPVIRITNTIHKQDKTWSIVGGLDASISNQASVGLAAGVVSSGNKVYTFSYDPFLKSYRGSVYLPIFNFKK